MDNETGDINIHTTQAQLVTGQNNNILGALDYIAQGASRQLLGVERNERQIGAARIFPNGMLPVPFN
jgi:predicted RNA-binding protein Jag